MRLLLGVVLVLLPAARLSAQPSVAAWDLLRRELVSTNPEHRKQAIMAIGSIGPAPEVITILNESLRDKDITIRQATAALMGELKYPGNVPNLQAALDDDSEVASQAAKSLVEYGRPQRSQGPRSSLHRPGTRRTQHDRKRDARCEG